MARTITEIIDILQRGIDSGNWKMVEEAIILLLDYDEYDDDDDSDEDFE